MLFFFFLFKEREFKLGTLFEISSGVLDDGSSFYSIDQNGNTVNLTMLRMASFNPVNKTLLEQQDIDLNLEKINRLRKTKSGLNLQKNTNEYIKQAIKSKEVSSNKILNGQDYLICTRKANDQPINGYSLINSAIDLQPENFGPSIISHHFICLRPRNDIADNYIPFLHLMLDSIIENQLIPLINGGNKSLLKTKTLNQLKVSIPTLYEEQKNIFSDYHNLKSEINNLELKMMNLKGNLSKNFVELNKIR
jgi:hypothetical protein